jgi:AcrR family transcriptional regulator
LKLDPRVKRTRKLLQQALTELMAEKSYRAITVGDIANRATVNRATFYAHFPDKQALLEYAIREMFRQRLRSQLPGAGLWNADNLAGLLQTVCEYLAEMDRHCPPPHGQMEPLMEEQIKAELYEILRAWMVDRPSGNRGSSPTADQAAMVGSWAIYGAAVQWTRQQRSVPIAGFVRQVLPLISASLQRAPAGGQN